MNSKKNNTKNTKKTSSHLKKRANTTAIRPILKPQTPKLDESILLLIKYARQNKLRFCQAIEVVVRFHAFDWSELFYLSDDKLIQYIKKSINYNK